MGRTSLRKCLKYHLSHDIDDLEDGCNQVINANRKEVGTFFSINSLEELARTYD